MTLCLRLPEANTCVSGEGRENESKGTRQTNEQDSFSPTQS